MSKSFKRNYVDVLQVITPSYYKGLDKESATDSTDLVAQILTTELNLVKNNFFIQPLSSFPLSLSSLLDWDAGEGYSKKLVNYLIKQNKLTEITHSEFDLSILKPLGYEIDNYNTSGEFKTFLTETLLPQIALGTDSSVNDLYTATEGAYGSDDEASHKFLLESLGLFHILNYTRATPNLDFQTLLADLLADKLYSGFTVGLVDAIKILKTGLWNCTDATTKAVAFPSPFASGTDLWTSGTQSLDKIKTWANIMYTEAYGSESDTYIRDSVADFVENGFYPDDLLPGGPFYRLQRAAGFLISDINDQIVSLETLHSIEDCPNDLLPYLADIIGWEFYTSNTDAWRRQLRSAISLYKQKGTRQGLENLIKVVLPSFNLDFSSQYNEFYESYVPNLMYYLLKTDSTLFSGLDSWTQDKAQSFSNGERDNTNLDNSIRFVIDNILLDSVEAYPHLFNLKGYAFNLNDPSFSFNFRNRNFGIPPWEYEKFYKDCSISEDLVEFLKNKLICLGVTISSAEAFYNYVLDNTVKGQQDPKYYNNGFFFLTSSMNLPPNYSTLMNNYDRDSFDFIPIWNGKSSHFNLSISSTNIDGEFFNPGAFDREDFFASLESIHKFVPAKAIPRSHIDLLLGDPYITFVALAPRATVSFLDQPSASGTMGGFQLCSVDMRSEKAGLLARYILPGFDDTKSRTTHLNKSVFKRDRLRFGIIKDQISTNYILSGYPLTLSGDYIPCLGRSSKRRRDNSKTLWKGDWFTRDGFNNPIRLNKGTVTGAGIKQSYDWGVSGYIPLGFNFSSYSFTPVTDTFDLPGVYESCETLDSSGVFYGVDTSNTFSIRGLDAIEVYEGHNYRYRDDIEDLPKLIYDLIKRKIHYKTLKFLDVNKHLFLFNNWKDFYGNVYNALWDSYDLTQDEFYNKKFGKYYRRGSKSSIRGLPYLYENFFAKDSFNQTTSYNLLTSYINGGGNILSKINGPYLWNGLLTLDGSGVDTTKTNKKNRSINDNNEFLLSAIGDDSIYKSETSSLYVKNPEYRNPYYFSGVEIIYDKATPNKMSVFSLSDNGNILDDDSALLENNLLGLKVTLPGSRLRFSFDYGDQDVLFSPEHEFSVTTKSIFMNDQNLLTGGRSYSVWIHTEAEKDFDGNYVFWNYSPNGKWEMKPVSTVTSKTKGLQNLINDLSHNIEHPQSSLTDAGNACFSEVTNLSKLWNLKKDNLVVDRLNFNTNNQPIKVPLSYYRAYNQVHREDQKYVIELIPNASIDSSKIWILDGISTVDETLKSYSRLEISSDIDDYSLENIVTYDPVRFFKEDGSLIPSGNDISIDLSGNMFFDNAKVTAAIGLSPNTGAPIAIPKLFIKINAYTLQKFYSNGTVKPQKQYTGLLRQVDYNNNFSLSSVKVIGTTRGSYIKSNFTEYEDLEPYQILEIMSFYKNQAITAQKRANQGPSIEFKAGPNGFYGGGRLNYRDIVVQGNWPAGVLLLAQRYTNISIIN